MAVFMRSRISEETVILRRAKQLLRCEGWVVDHFTND